ncbi:DUF1254 domain-containing protein [Carboxylicivirga mesophila]|uniref:DUF1254 domain-containing protein n=1 Tax=Carboxylicivirga mesophila TaxID=1166478 RepID=A0ABS5KFI7_9BACT|nr:DUF1254 domain-containing protein [Carboxylicivirga mesophila]MBS2213622.1 DUF1254 domain-containing protein [Carboxylicivirga mesophila]
MKNKIILSILALAMAISACNPKPKEITANEAKQIAKEAYIYAYPMLEHYKMMFAMAMYPESGAYQAPFNVLTNNSKLNGPEDTIIVRPNNDTFYSAVWFNLSAQPQILTVPAITDGRYYSFQIIDMYTHNIDYIGTRKTGFDAGAYMFVGPDWKGETPEGISKVIQSEGNFLLALGRTQVFGPDDVEIAKDVIDQYGVQSLNAYNGLVEAAVIGENPPIPPYHPEKVSNEHFISYLNALMATGPIHPTEEALFKRFAKIGIQPGQAYHPEDYSPEIIAAIREGIDAGRKELIDASTQLGVRKNGWQQIAGAFGTRTAMKEKYLTRAAAAYFGLWGNDLEEAFYPETTFDTDKEELNGSKHDYILHFEADELPPAKAFWSLTMYKLPEQLLIENEIDRYVIGSATKGLKYNEDGSLDVYIQKENPGRDKVSNWLPAHDGPFSLQTRIYWPEPSALAPLYTMPAVQKKL